MPLRILECAGQNGTNIGALQRVWETDFSCHDYTHASDVPIDMSCWNTGSYCQSTLNPHLAGLHMLAKLLQACTISIVCCGQYCSCCRRRWKQWYRNGWKLSPTLPGFHAPKNTFIDISRSVWQEGWLTGRLWNFCTIILWHVGGNLVSVWRPAVCATRNAQMKPSNNANYWQWLT